MAGAAASVGLVAVVAALSVVVAWARLRVGREGQAFAAWGAMLVAAEVHRPQGFAAQSGGNEYPITLGVAAAALALTGPGRFSVDHVLGDQIELAKLDLAGGFKHHMIPVSWVEYVDDDKVRLNLTKDEAKERWTEKH